MQEHEVIVVPTREELPGRPPKKWQKEIKARGQLDTPRTPMTALAF